MGRGGAEKLAYSDGRDVVRFAGKLDPEIKEVTVWLHVRSGARLKERLGRTVRGDDCGLPPSWDDIVLEVNIERTC